MELNGYLVFECKEFKLIVSRIPYRETEDYIADSVALLALESYEKQLKD